MAERGLAPQNLLELIIHAMGSDNGISGERSKYLLMVGPKDFPSIVTKIEEVNSLRDSLPDALKGLVSTITEPLIRALMSTPSIKGGMLNMMTTQRAEYKFTDPGAKRGILSAMQNGGFP